MNQTLRDHTDQAVDFCHTYLGGRDTCACRLRTEHVPFAVDVPKKLRVPAQAHQVVCQRRDIVVEAATELLLHPRTTPPTPPRCWHSAGSVQLGASPRPATVLN